MKQKSQQSNHIFSTPVFNMKNLLLSPVIPLAQLDSYSAAIVEKEEDDIPVEEVLGGDWEEDIISEFANKNNNCNDHRTDDECEQNENEIENQ